MMSVTHTFVCQKENARKSLFSGSKDTFKTRAVCLCVPPAGMREQGSDEWNQDVGGRGWERAGASEPDPPGVEDSGSNQAAHTHSPAPAPLCADPDLQDPLENPINTQVTNDHWYI